jgi:pectinesterase
LKLLSYTYFFFAFSCATHAQILDKSWKELVQKNDASWLGSMEAKQVAENVLLLQKDIGVGPRTSNRKN